MQRQSKVRKKNKVRLQKNRQKKGFATYVNEKDGY